MKELTLQLFDYHFWANKRLIECIERLPNDIFNNRVDSVFPTIADTFAHMNAVDQVWYSRMKEQVVQQIAAKVFNSPGESLKEITYLHQEIKSFLVNMDNVEKKLIYQNTKGEPFTNKIYEIVQHMVNHGTHHRGNISAMIRQMGYEGVSTDYIVYLRNA